MTKKSKIVFGWLVFIIIADQVTKFIVDQSMPLHHSIPVIDNLFSLTYIRNTGAAFGILVRKRGFLSTALPRAVFDTRDRLCRYDAATFAG